MPYVLPGVDIYGRKQTDEKLHKKNYFLRLKGLWDSERLLTDRENYRKELLLISGLLNGVDFHQNVLVFCDEDINKEFFISAYSSLESYLSMYYCNALHINDIWWQESKSVIETDYHSAQEINQRVLCLFGDKEMWLNEPGGQIINSLISSRSAGYRSDGLPQYTWIFLRGKYVDFTAKTRNNKQLGWYLILDMFNENANQKFLMLDLNGDPEFMSKLKASRSQWLSKKLKQERPIKSSLIVSGGGGSVSGGSAKTVNPVDTSAVDDLY